jgi:hypothetical protein
MPLPAAKLVLKARIDLSHGARYSAAACSTSRFLFADDGRYSVFDTAFDTGPTSRATGALPCGMGAIAMSPSGSVFGVGAKNEWCFCDVHGQVLARHARREHRAWESVGLSFLDEARVVTAEPDGAGVPLQCMLWATGEALHALRIPLPASGGHHLYARPSEPAWILWNAAGQEGQWSYRVSLDESGFQTVELEDVGATEHGPPAFTPDGSAYAVVTEDGVSQWRSADDVFQYCVPHDEDQRFSCVLPVDARMFLALAEEGSDLWLVDKEGKRTMLDLDDAIMPNAGRLWSIESLPDGCVLTVHGSPMGGPQRLTLYSVSFGASNA